MAGWRTPGNAWDPLDSAENLAAAARSSQSPLFPVIFAPFYGRQAPGSPGLHRFLEA